MATAAMSMRENISLSELTAKNRAEMQKSDDKNSLKSQFTGAIRQEIGVNISKLSDQQLSLVNLIATLDKHGSYLDDIDILRALWEAHTRESYQRKIDGEATKAFTIILTDVRNAIGKTLEILGAERSNLQDKEFKMATQEHCVIA